MAWTKADAALDAFAALTLFGCGAAAVQGNWLCFATFSLTALGLHVLTAMVHAEKRRDAWWDGKLEEGRRRPRETRPAPSEGRAA